MTRTEVAKRISNLYDTRSLRTYVYWKLRTDPAYDAVHEKLRGHEAQSLLDIGCGLGPLAFSLRERGFNGPILGIDLDGRKIEAARKVADQYRGIAFIIGDARDPLPANHNAVLLDILQYLGRAERQELLQNVVRTIPPDGIAILRQGIRDDSWRHKVSKAVDALVRATPWMQGGPVRFPTIEEVSRPFAGAFDAEITPLWGGTPFNNYLFVFRRREVARQQE